MLKQINQKLLSQYPLLWNTKVAVMLPLAIIIHVLFYVTGFFHPIQVNELWVNGYFYDYTEVVFSVLVTTLSIIIWLSFYLRNNPFKSFYTLGRGYMFKEFLLIFIIFFTSSTYFLSYKQGFYDNIERKTNDIDILQDATTINLSAHFLAFDYSDFNIYNCCDSIEARRVRDSIETAYKETLTPQELRAYVYKKEQNPIVKDTVEYPNSYLYYCKQEIAFYDYPTPYLPDEYHLNGIAQQWLGEGKKDSVLKLFNNLLSLCKKYGVSYNFIPKEQVEECFNDSLFTVRKTLSSYYIDSTAFLNGAYESDEYDNAVQQYIDTYYYIIVDDLKQSLQRIHTVRHSFWTINYLIIWLYCAFGATIILFSFRITRLKHWFMGIIGIGLWAILLSLVEIALSLNDNFPILLILIWLALFILTIINIRKRQKKLITGLVLNWVIWFSIFIIPLAFVIINLYTRFSCPDFDVDVVSLNCEINRWVNSHWALINSINMALMIVAIYFVFIPLARNWQSNPEE